MKGWAAFLIFLLPAAAAAQADLTPAQLQQLAIQDANQYGIPPQVFLDQIQAESGFNPNIGCNSIGACGVAQFIPSTAQQFNLDPLDPVASLQAAAQYDARLVQQTGSLTGALTAYSGGCTPASPCNSSYGQAFQLAQQYDASGGTATFGDGSTLSAGAGSGATGAAAPATPAAGGTLSQPFCWAWTNIMGDVQQGVGTITPKVQQIAWQPIVPILVLSGIFMGVRLWNGRVDLADSMAWLITMGITIGLVFPGNQWYTAWEGFAETLPTYFASNIGLQSTTCPMGMFDSVWLAFYAKILNVWHTSPWEKILLTALLLFFIFADLVIALGSMAFTYLGANFALYLLLAIGAVFLLGLLFTGTHGFFRFWIDLTVAIIAFILAVNVMLNFFTIVINQLISATGSVTTPYTDMLPSLLGAVIVFNILAGANIFLAFQFGRLQGMSSAALNRGITGASGKYFIGLARAAI